LLIFDEIVRWIQISSTAVFLALLMGKTFYLRRKERLNAIIFGSGRKKSNGLFSILSVLIVNIWIVFILLYHLNETFHSWLSFFNTGIIDTIWVKSIGLLILFLAFAIFIMAQTALGNSWRLGIDTVHPGRLITGNIYALSRHPIYLFFDLYFFSVFLTSANLVFLLFTVMIAVILHCQAILEEKFLSGLYGREYIKYVSRVGRYISISWKNGVQIQGRSNTAD